MSANHPQNSPTDSPAHAGCIDGIVLCFALGRPDGNVDAVATDTRGKFITAQVCSSEGWAKSDLRESKFHGWFYRARFGEDYRIEWSDQVPAGWDGQRKHTDETVRPWHRDPANGSSLFPENDRTLATQPAKKDSDSK